MEHVTITQRNGRRHLTCTVQGVNFVISDPKMMLAAMSGSYPLKLQHHEYRLKGAYTRV